MNFTKQPVIYSLTSTGRIQAWQVELDNTGRYRTSYWLHPDGKVQTTEWTLVEAKNLGRANETSQAEQAELEVAKMTKDRVDAGGTTDPDAVHSVRESLPPLAMLAAKWDGKESSIQFPILSDPKFDGTRLLVREDGLWSRNGKKYVSIPHIAEATAKILAEYPGITLDGEVYNHSLKDDFNKLISIVRKTKPTAADLEESRRVMQYHIYDVITPQEMGVLQRRELLAQIEASFPSIFHGNPLVRVKHTVCHSMNDIHEEMAKLLDEGYEGQMLRAADSTPYEQDRRSKSLLKNKVFQDEEAEVLEIIEGRGNRSGMLGAFKCRRLSNGAIFQSAMKGTNAERKAIWENRADWPGRQVTFAFFQTTPDGNPRFPVVVKYDKDL